MNKIDKPNPSDAYLRRKKLGITWQQEKAIEMGYTDLETVLKENKASEKKMMNTSFAKTVIKKYQ